MTQASLADLTNVSRGYISELVSGKKAASPAMLEKIRSALGIQPGELFETVNAYPSPDRPRVRTGFSEGDAAPFLPKMTSRIADIGKIIAPNARHVSSYFANKSMPYFGILSGDMLIVDLNCPHTSGDLVVATIANTSSGQGVTRILRVTGDLLVPHDISEQPFDLNDDQHSIGINAVLKGCVRGPAITPH